METHLDPDDGTRLKQNVPARMGEIDLQIRHEGKEDHNYILSTTQVKQFS